MAFEHAVQDVESLKQVIYTFGKPYTILRAKITGINARGRLDNIVVKETIFACILPSNKRINTNNDGKGRWFTAEAEISCVIPQYFSLNDIIEVPGRGKMKVVSLNDLREYGVITGSLIRIGTTDPQTPNSNKPYEPT